MSRPARRPEPPPQALRIPILPGQRDSALSSGKDAPKAPRKLRIAWVVVTLLFVLIAVPLTPLVAFFVWSLFALPLTMFSKYRPLPQRRWLRIPMLMAWFFLLVFSYAIVFAHVNNPVVQNWGDMMEFDPAIAGVVVIGTAVFPLVTFVFAQRARKKPHH